MNGLESTEVVAVADPTSDLLNAFREQMPGLATYSDHEKLLANEQIDAALIAAPNDLHIPIALDCAKRDIPFLVEKPLCPRSADADPLLTRLKEKPLVNAVGYMYRHSDIFVKAKEVLDAQPLGKLMHLRATMYVAQLFKRGKGWRYNKAKSGGGVLNIQNSHLLDTLKWYFGPVATVSGHVKSAYSAEVEDFAHAWLTFKSGLTGFIDCSWSIRHYRTPEIYIDINGANGTLTVTDDTVRLFLDQPAGGFDSGWTTWRKPDVYRPVPVDIGGPQYTHQDADFIDAVRNNRPVACDVPSAHHVQSIIDAVYESSAAGGQPINIAGVS